MVFDHFFILTAPGAPEAQLLSDIGLIEGTPNDHPGQGTANRRFFLSNCALELLYVRDAREADEGPAHRLRFPERASDPGASPFGLVFKGDPGLVNAPFAGWHYQPDYFEPGRGFVVGDNSELLAEPLCILMPFDPPAPTGQPLPGEPFARVTELRIFVPVENPTPVLETVSKVDRISLRTGTAHLLEVVFNHEKERQVRDLRPALPMVIRW